MGEGNAGEFLLPQQPGTKREAGWSGGEQVKATSTMLAKMLARNTKGLAQIS
jgi:hypothetical protein